MIRRAYRSYRYIHRQFNTHVYESSIDYIHTDEYMKHIHSIGKLEHLSFARQLYNNNSSDYNTVHQYILQLKYNGFDYEANRILNRHMKNIKYSDIVLLYRYMILKYNIKVHTYHIE